MGEQVIIFDGECRFCRWSVVRIQRFDDYGQFEYLPRQATGMEIRFPFLVDSDFNTGLRLVTEGPVVYVGADAVYQIYRRIPPFYLITWIYLLPFFRQLSQLGYRLIARNRHRFGRVECDVDACTRSYGEQLSPTKRLD